MQRGDEFNSPYKIIKEDWFFHNPTRANVGSLGRVPEVPEDAITSPEYQVWRIKAGFLPDYMELLIKTDYFLSLVGFNRVGGVKQRMYFDNLAEIRLPFVTEEHQRKVLETRMKYIEQIKALREKLSAQEAKFESALLESTKILGS